ncbi:NAD(P)/FAD-dependent oxidoreductase [Luteolibacter ambystomatis]|uniref:NAD(P)/FAD-dependent oxidoreductase n=1 Tax=Luteolibacter ambystomatis TaxID=2824561 RepID=A0A975IZ26_9BACT|nr:NAD(P)/FAD-dependent oxidoreductase [Luteolibacter ambystomatis]QUE50488.1 NAD(P)/FAD-dependent oxidoreductase [Luteolibacter ambystomatis]
MKSYDLLVIGGGSAGYAAARTASDLGKRVAVADGARELGGLCILRGCMPSKTLLHATEVLHHARKGKTFGLRIPTAEVDMKALHRWKVKTIREFADYRVQGLESGKFDLYRSHARFTGPKTVALSDGTEIAAEKILISTGSKVSSPPIPGLAETPHWTSDDVLDLDFVPESVIVLGGGIVACELAQFLRRIGSKVTLIQRSPHLLKEFSESAAAVVEQAFRDEGIQLHTGTKIEKISTTTDGVSAKFTKDGKTLTRRAAYLFNALGREPNTGGLNVEAAGVKLTDAGRVAVNRWQQTSRSHIYAGGDVCGPHDIVHLAVSQGELAARHAFGVKSLKPIDPDLLLSVVFTDPPLATLGLQEKELKERNIPFLSASYPFDDHGKSILMDATYGYVKLFADPKRGGLLGAEIVGTHADSLIHCLTGPLAMKATVYDLLRAPWYHPTLAEILTYPLEEIAEKLS